MGKRWHEKELKKVVAEWMGIDTYAKDIVTQIQ